MPVSSVVTETLATQSHPKILTTSARYSGSQNPKAGPQGIMESTEACLSGEAVHAALPRARKAALNWPQFFAAQFPTLLTKQRSVQSSPRTHSWVGGAVRLGVQVFPPYHPPPQPSRVGLIIPTTQMRKLRHNEATPNE